MRAYVERLTSVDGAPVVRAWTFDLASWGSLGAGPDVESAALDLQRWTGAHTVDVVEEIDGVDVAFSRDLDAAVPGERAATIAIARAARRRTLDLLADTEEGRLDRPVSDAGEAGEVLRIAGLHVVSARDVLEWLIQRESVDDPAALLADPCPLDEDLPLATRLRSSHESLMTLIRSLPPRLIRAGPDGSEWSTVKLLRTVAWRERALSALLTRLLA